MPKQQFDRSPDNVRRKFNDPDHYLCDNFEVTSRAGILRKMLPSVEGLTILDIGCGDGSLSLQFLAEAEHVTLVDLSQGMLLRAEAKIPPALSHKVTVANADLMQFVPTEPADVVICVGVLAHVERLGPAILKLASMTKTGRTVRDPDYGSRSGGRQDPEHIFPRPLSVTEHRCIGTPTNCFRGGIQDLPAREPLPIAPGHGAAARALAPGIRQLCSQLFIVVSPRAERGSDV
jgi:SAM-dependent methyltransferase